MNIRKIFHTVRYMNKRQILFRVKYEMMKRVRKNVPLKVSPKPNEKYLFKQIHNKKEYEKDNKCIIVANKLLENEFTFLNNLTYQFNDEIEWTINPFEYRLWNFNLNYFDYLEVLSEAFLITNNHRYIAKGFELITSWISQCKYYDQNLWDPYVVSKRIYNFINFIVIYKDEIKKYNVEEINLLIYSQGIYLSKNIEYYLDANHVIMDGKGLIFSGVYFNDKKLLNQGLDILLTEYGRQVLEDGGHYERSPSYQVEVLSHYIETYILLHNNNYICYCDKLYNIINKMSIYLKSLIMPNGNIPLLNDSSLDYPFKADDLLQISSVILNKRVHYNKKLSRYASLLLSEEECKKFYEINNEIYKEIQNELLCASGYYIIKDIINEEELYLLFDSGDCGPDCNLGHAHADNLNIIVNLGGKEFIHDLGTFTYQIGEKRNLYRSTKAHNTVCIDGKNSSDVWSGFRVGKRAKTTLCKYENTDLYTHIVAEHDGYTKMLNSDRIIHKREVVYIKQKAIIIIDKLYGKMKENHECEINYNLLKENFNIENKSFSTENNYIKLEIDNDVSITLGKYSQEFNCEKDNLNLRYKWKFNSNTDFVTLLKFNNENIKIKSDENYFYIIDEDKTVIKVRR